MSNNTNRSENMLSTFAKSKSATVSQIKTYLGKKGYTIRLKDFTEEQILKIKEDLTFKPFRPPGYGPEPESFSVFGISKNKMFLPKFYGIETFGKPDKIKLNKGTKIKLDFNGSLRPNQRAPVEACLKASEDTGGGILCLPCGAGKTSIALYLIATLKVKALVVVNKEFLMDQWKERIEQFLPDARIGILRQKKINVENKDIVIAMLQSVAMCGYDAYVYDTFGISFYDEVHCVPSKVFSKALRKINTTYHFGLSATPNRADGMTKVTKLYIGPIIYKVNTRKSKKNPKNLRVFTIAFNKTPEGKLYRSLSNYKGKPDVVRMISNIIKCPKRLALVSMILRYFILEDKRHILVLSERIQYLHDIENKIRLDYYNATKEDIENKLNKHIPNDIAKLSVDKIKKIKLPFKIGYYIGGMKKKERKESESADLILASYSMAKEAMDIPILDTLLMATSKSNIEQSVGRIQRKTEYPDERPPLVIDLIDKFSSFYTQSFKRERFYKKKHYPVTNFIFDEDDSKQLYTDFTEEIKNITDYPSDILETESDSETESCNQKLEPVSQKSLKPLVQTKIDGDLYGMIGDGDFDI